MRSRKRGERCGYTVHFPRVKIFAQRLSTKPELKPTFTSYLAVFVDLDSWTVSIHPDAVLSPPPCAFGYC